ncbi:BTAD domain-containing putative transcriptional regulator [Winogradskya consettensis]
MRFALLGPLRVWRDGEELGLGPRQQRLMLALLLARAGRPVRADELVELVWGDKPPASAANVVHRYIGMLRRLFEPALAPRSQGGRISGDLGGYVLRADPGELDLLDFRRLAEAGRDAADRGDPQAATSLFMEAFALWGGDCAADLRATHPAFAAVENEICGVAREAAAAALAGGGAATILSTVEKVAQRHPFDEALQARLLVLLAADGQRDAARMLYVELTQRLADELGMAPGAEVQAAYRQVAGGQAAPMPASKHPIPLVVPAQLPPDLPFFIGRESELARVREVLEQPRSGLNVLVIDGMPGVGKTTLALHVSHEVAPRFPDGQLYADLHGFDPGAEVADPVDVLQWFLTALGVPQGTIPESVEGRSALFRSVLAGRRVLVVLDNVRHADQVRPLLPGSADCLVVVTGRGRLTGLATAQGATVLSLDLPSLQEARDAVAERVGQDRVAPEPEVLDAIIERCGRLPLALAIVSSRAAALPAYPLSVIAEDLLAVGENLDVFHDYDFEHDVRAVFSWSYRLLGPAAARLFRLLPLHPGPDMTIRSVAALAGVPQATARDLVGELTRTRLLDRYKPGRYRLHDLVRTYAAELGDEVDPRPERQAALARVRDHYRRSAHAAHSLLRPYSLPVSLPEPLPGVQPVEFADDAEATAWFAAERLVLRAVLEQCAAAGEHEVAWQLALTMALFLGRHGYWHDWLAVLTIGHGSALVAGDPEGVARTAQSLAGANQRLGDNVRALGLLETAYEYQSAQGDATVTANVLMNMGVARFALGDTAGAIRDHTAALDRLKGLEHPKLEGAVLWHLARGHLRDGGLAGAVRLAGRSLATFAAIDDPSGQASALNLLAEARSAGGDQAGALHDQERSIGYATRAGDRANLIEAYTNLGDIHLAMGNLAAARRAWTQAVAQVEDGSLLPVIRAETRLREYVDE